MFRVPPDSSRSRGWTIGQYQTGCIWCLVIGSKQVWKKRLGVWCFKEGSYHLLIFSIRDEAGFISISLAAITSSRRQKRGPGSGLSYSWLPKVRAMASLSLKWIESRWHNPQGQWCIWTPILPSTLKSLQVDHWMFGFDAYFRSLQSPG